MEKIRDWITEHKKQTIAIAIVIILVICAGIGGCVALSGGNDTPAAEEETEKEEMSFTAEDLAGVVTGMDGDTYILAGADVDLLSLIAYDDSIVTAVAADTSSLDVATAGDYTITLEFTVDAKALAEYLGEDFDADKYTDTAKIQVEKVIKVVDQATAQSLADAGTPVYNGTGSTVPKSNGTAVEATVAAPESTSKTGGTSKADNTKHTASTTTKKNTADSDASAGSNDRSNTQNTSSGTSGNNSSDTNSAVGNNNSFNNTGSSDSNEASGITSNNSSSQPNIPPHTHNWVDQGTLKMDWSAAYQENTGYTSNSERVTSIYVCRTCGMFYGRSEDMLDQLYWSHVNETLHSSYMVVDVTAVYHLLQCSGCGIYKRGNLAFYEYPAWKNGNFYSENQYSIQLTPDQINILGLKQP